MRDCGAARSVRSLSKARRPNRNRRNIPQISQYSQLRLRPPMGAGSSDARTADVIDFPPSRPGASKLASPVQLLPRPLARREGAAPHHAGRDSHYDECRTSPSFGCAPRPAAAIRPPDRHLSETVGIRSGRSNAGPGGASRQDRRGAGRRPAHVVADRTRHADRGIKDPDDHAKRDDWPAARRGAGIPQLFLADGSGRWDDPQHFHWTMALAALIPDGGSYRCRLHPRTKPDAKIGVLVQDSLCGKDYVSGLEEGLEIARRR